MTPQPMKARIGISGTFEFKDKDGNVLKTMSVSGSVPLARTGMTVEEAQQFVTNQKEIQHGPDHCK